MRNYIHKCANDYIDLTKAITDFYQPKKKDKNEEEIDRNVDKSYTLNCPGGWPLQVRHTPHL